MSNAYLAPSFGAAFQAFTNQGVVLAGGILNFYVGGSVSTPQTLYTDSTAGTPWGTSLTLNSAGRVPSGGEIWIPAGVLVKFVLTDASLNVLGTWDNVQGIGDLTGTGVLTGEWVSFGTGTYVGTTSFSVPGNQTVPLTAYRRLKIGQSGGFIFGYVSYVTPPVYGGGVTTVTVVVDGNASITNPVSAVSYGFLNAQGPSSPNVFTNQLQINANINPCLYIYNASNTATYTTIANLNGNINFGASSSTGGGLIIGDTAFYGEIMASTGLSISGNSGLSPQMQFSISGGIQAQDLFFPLKHATAGAPAYVKGAMYFDTTLNKLRIGGATAWETVTSV